MAKEKLLSPLAKKLMNVCIDKRDYLEILTLFRDALYEQEKHIRVEIQEKVQEIHTELRNAENLQEWEQAWDETKESEASSHD